MQQTINTNELTNTGWRLLSKNNLLQSCEACGNQEEFLMSFSTKTSQSRQLCSGCYAQAIVSRLYVFPQRA